MHDPAANPAAVGPDDIFGYFEPDDGALACGWVCNRRDFATPVRLEAMRAGETLATLAADGAREDLRRHGIGTGAHGFRLDPAAIGRAGGRGEAPIELYVAGTDILLRSGEGGAVTPRRMFRTQPARAGRDYAAFCAATMDVELHVDHPHAMIGDSITALPVIAQLARMFARPVHVTGAFSRLVRPLLPPGMLAEGVEGAEGAAGPVALRLSLGIGAARNAAAAAGLHASQGFFLLADMAPPPLPIALDLRAAPCGLAPGAVFAPFTASERGVAGDHRRMWYPERWAAVAAWLRAAHGLQHVHVIGASSDDFTGFDFPGAIHVIDRPMPQVLDLMRAAAVCVTVETGPSHLAHFGGVRRHVLLYGDLHPPALVATSIGAMVRGPVAAARVEEVCAAIAGVLAG